MIIDRVDIARVIAGSDFNVIVALTNALLTQSTSTRSSPGSTSTRSPRQLDVNALIEKVDIDAIVQRTQLEAIVTRASAGVASEADRRRPQRRCRTRRLRPPLGRSACCGARTTPAGPPGLRRRRRSVRRPRRPCRDGELGGDAAVTGGDP
jgi:hypothetical protein